MKTPTLNRLDYKASYRRNLPHIQPVTATLFVTFRLYGSLPKSVFERMAEEKRLLDDDLRQTNISSKSRDRQLARRYFVTLEECLARATSGPTWLAQPDIAEVVSEALHYRDGKQYRLDAFSIMPNHVHAVFAPMASEDVAQSLSSIMHSLKRNTAKSSNRLLNRSGHFWQHETFDHYIRDDTEWRKIIRYVLENPVKAGLVKNWEDWQWNYVRRDVLNP